MMLILLVEGHTLRTTPYRPIQFKSIQNIRSHQLIKRGREAEGSHEVKAEKSFNQAPNTVFWKSLETLIA